MSDPHRDRDPAELDALVSELETTLAELRTELADRGRERGGGSPRDGPFRRSDDRDRRGDSDGRDRRARGTPRPPSVGDLLGFTTDYTIPTVVAVLEATIEALELLRGVLKLAAPGERPKRRARGRDRRRGAGESMLSEALTGGVTSATDRAATDAADALVRLRETLAAADLPADGESGDLVADARDLSTELERRVRESRDAVDRERDRNRDRTDRRGDSRDGGPVSIDVGAPDGTIDDESAESESTDDDDAPEVDVDAELESIKRRIGERNRDRGDESDDDPAA